MLSKSNKIISAAVTVLALGTVGVTAAVASNSINMAGPVQTSSSVVSFSSVTDSSIMSASSVILSASSTESINSKSSSAPSQNGKVTKVADESNKAQENSPTSSSAQKSQSSIQLKPGASIDRIKKNQESIKWPVIDPDTGNLISPNYSNYEAIKAELGGDAGTVDPDHSTACQKAKEEARQKYLASQAASSKVQKPAVPGQGDPNK